MDGPLPDNADFGEQLRMRQGCSGDGSSARWLEPAGAGTYLQYSGSNPTFFAFGLMSLVCAASAPWPTMIALDYS